MWRVWLKLLVSGTLLWWMLARTPLSSIAFELARLDARTVLLGAALSVAAWLLSALRLWCIAPQFGIGEIIRMTFIALLYGTVLPGQVAGDAVKAYRLSRFQTIPGQALAAILVDRGLALLALLAIGAGAAFQLAEVPISLRAILFAALAGLVGVGWLLALRIVRDRVVALAEARVGYSARIFGFIGRLAHALHDALRRPRQIALSLILAFAFHALCVAILVLLARALGLDIGIGGWSVVYAGVSVLTLLPFSIAGIGLREGGFVGFLGMFGVSREIALALSFTFLGYTLFGAMLGLLVELAPNARERTP